MAKIKICGLKRTEDIDYVNSLKPDYIGFILTNGYKRSITVQQAAELKNMLDSNIKAVGVFVDDDIEKINSLINEKTIDLVQLHGSESPEYCEKVNAPVIKCLKPNMFSCADNYNTEYLLFDSGTGSGKTFDWSEIPGTAKPFFLAGGINADNINNAINEIHPYCIDISSAVETGGVKDYNKIKQIMESMKK